jgi:ATP-binding cassette subfamily C protein CydCD
VTLRTAFLSALVLELIATISVAVVAVFIGIRMLDGQLGLATGLLVLILAPECFQPFRDLGTAFHASRAGLAALGTAERIIDAPARTDIRVTDPEIPELDGIIVEALTVTHEGRSPVVRDVAFTLPSHGVTALVGASGAGKSTVLRALAGRLDADLSGRVLGIDPTRVAWAPQHPHTVGSTVRDELLLYSTNEFAVEWMLARLGLLSVAEADPARLSPGELRRVAVARAMLRVDDGANLVLLDEPTAHLDDQSAAAVVSLIHWAGERASVFVASHDAAVTAIATRFVELGGAGDRGTSHGRTRGSADPAAVTEHDGLGLGTVDRPMTAARGEVAAALVAFVRPALGRYLAAIALGTLAAGFAIALTAVSAWLIVRASELPAIMYLLVAIVGVRFFGLGRAVLRYCERLVTHDAVFASTTALRHRLWASLAARGASSRVLQRGGTALDYLVGAADDVRDLVPRIVVPTAVGVVVSALALLTTWLILPAATGVMALVILGGAIVAPALSVLSDRAAESDRLRQRTGMLRRFSAALDAADDLRGNDADARVRARIADLDAQAGRASRRVALSRGLGAAVVVLSACLGAMGMLAVSATSGIPVALAAVLVLLPIALIDPLLGLLGGLAHAPALTTALAHVGELDEPPARRARDDAPALVETLELRDLAVAWPGGDPVFRGLDVTLGRGDWLVVEGPSGSGKSTLLTALLGSLPAHEGRILLDGHNSHGLRLAGTVAWCPQESHLFDSTLRANLLLGRPRDDRPDDTELVDALTSAGLGALLAELPDGLDTRIGSQGSRLSGGERQRVAIARTLLSRAGVVLLDEPTAHLDEETARDLMADLRSALADRIVVLVTHHADDVRPGDHRISLGVPEVIG